MTIKIHIVDKDTLAWQKSIDAGKAGMIATEGMTISSYAASLKSTEATIPYDIEVVAEHVPYIKEPEFCLTVRKKVNLTATGINEQNRTNIGEDVGKDNYKDSVPSRPLDLPPGFRELYKE